MKVPIKCTSICLWRVVAQSSYSRSRRDRSLACLSMRRRCKFLVTACRCNFSPEQRATWLLLADEVAGGRDAYHILALHLSMPPALCRRRCATRAPHPTLDAALANSVINRCSPPLRHPPSENMCRRSARTTRASLHVQHKSSSYRSGSTTAVYPCCQLSGFCFRRQQRYPY